MKMVMNIGTLQKHFQKHKESAWVLRPASVQALYEIVKTNDIKNVLELGTGVGLSTAVIALALEQKGAKDYTITTVEQKEKCVALAKELIPEELRKSIKFHLIEPVLWEDKEFAGLKFANFKEIPEGNYDLIVVDGPGPFLVDGRLAENPNGDVLRLHLEGKIGTGTKIYFDGRVQALGYIERYFGENYWLLNEPNKQSNLLERKDNAVKIDDARKKYYEQTGYFN